MTSDSSHRASICLYRGSSMREEPESTIDEKSEFPSEGDGTRAWAERWLSPERFEPYLAACDGDAGRALDLYEWNAALAQVVMREICHFEIALRNAYDRVMRERWEGDWLLDDGSPARVPLMRKSGARRAGRELHEPAHHRRRRRRAAEELPARRARGEPHAGVLGPPHRPLPRGRDMEDVPLPRMGRRGRGRKELQRSLNGILPREEPGGARRAPVRPCRGGALSPLGGFRRHEAAA